MRRGLRTTTDGRISLWDLHEYENFTLLVDGAMILQRYCALQFLTKTDASHLKNKVWTLGSLPTLIDHDLEGDAKNFWEV